MPKRWTASKPITTADVGKEVAFAKPATAGKVEEIKVAARQVWRQGWNVPSDAKLKCHFLP